MYYPGLFYRWGGRWPQTRDGVIPYKLFLMLLVQLDKLDGSIELRDARSAALGIQIAMNGKDNKLRSAVRTLTKRSFPEINDG